MLFRSELKTPIITGIGHETDTTIADLVADLRAATPTAAIQMAVPDILEIEQVLEVKYKRLRQVIKQKLDQQRVLLNMQKSHPTLTQPARLIMSHQLQLSQFAQVLSNQANNVHHLRLELNDRNIRLSQRILSFTNTQAIRVSRSKDLLIKRIENKTISQSNTFSQTLKLLNAFSPLNSLARGYSIVSQDEGVIRLKTDIDYDKALQIRLFDGILHAKAIKEPNDE